MDNLTEEIDTARAERRESQRQLQIVIKEREELAEQVVFLPLLNKLDL
jgi:hypothetical protein